MKDTTLGQEAQKTPKKKCQKRKIKKKTTPKCIIFKLLETK